MCAYPRKHVVATVREHFLIRICPQWDQLHVFYCLPEISVGDVNCERQILPRSNLLFHFHSLHVLQQTDPSKRKLKGRITLLFTQTEKALLSFSFLNAASLCRSHSIGRTACDGLAVSARARLPTIGFFLLFSPSPRGISSIDINSSAVWGFSVARNSRGERDDGGCRRIASPSRRLFFFLILLFEGRAIVGICLQADCRLCP